MTKKLVFFVLLSLLIAAFLAPTALAKLSDEQQKNIEDIYRQIEALKKRLVDEYLKAGVITEHEAAWMKERAELMTQFRLEQNAQGIYKPCCFGGHGGMGRGGARGAGFRMRVQAQ